MKKILTLIFAFVLISAPAFADDIPGFYHATCLIGGGTCLDGIDGQDLMDGYTAQVITASYYYIFILDDDSGAAESSPNTIAPDTNAGDKRWVRIDPYITP